MFARFTTIGIIGIAWMNSLTLAQTGPAPSTAAAEHKWLQKFVGEWETESEISMGPGQPNMKTSGTVSYRMVGSLWLVADMTGNIPGGTVTAVQTVGYDDSKKKYVGTWIDSMMNHLWIYEGTVDATGTTLALEADGPNFFEPGKTARYQDAYEFKSPDHIVATSSAQNAEGKWVTFMTANFHRKKQ